MSDNEQRMTIEEHKIMRRREAQKRYYQRNKETKIKYAKLAVEMDMSFSQLVRRALRELEAKTKKDQAATRS